MLEKRLLCQIPPKPTVIQIIIPELILPSGAAVAEAFLPNMPNLAHPITVNAVNQVIFDAHIVAFVDRALLLETKAVDSADVLE